MLNNLKQFLTKQIYFKDKSIIFGKKTKINKNCFFEGNNSIGANSAFFNSSLGRGSYISKNCNLNKTKIGRFCSIGQNLVNGVGLHPSKDFVSTHPAFFSNAKQAGFSFVENSIFEEHKFVDKDKKYLVEIGNDVWIGNNVVIFDGVKIGNGAIVGTNALVTKDIEPYTIVGGVPAKIIRRRFTQDQIDFLMEFKWWDREINWLKDNINKFDNVETFISTFSKSNV